MIFNCFGEVVEGNLLPERHFTLLVSMLPRASSLMDVVTPSCRTKSTGFTTPDLEQGTFTTIIRTFLRRSSVGRASRKLSSCKLTSGAFVKVHLD